jgi:hypothetical protein
MIRIGAIMFSFTNIFTAIMVKDWGLAIRLAGLRWSPAALVFWGAMSPINESPQTALNLLHVARHLPH